MVRLRVGRQIPDAEDAKVTQKTQKMPTPISKNASYANDAESINFGFSFGIFCVFCVTFAPSASGCSAVSFFIRQTPRFHEKSAS
jgi:hypothetical protein